MKALSAGEAPQSTRVFAPDFRYCLAASVALHLLFVAVQGLHLSSGAPPDAMEIDLTMPFVGNGPAKLGAPKKLVPTAKLPPAPAPEPIAPEPPKTLAPQPPKNWTLPGPQTKTVVPPKPEAPPPTQGGAKDGTGTAPIVGGHGPGFDYGVPNGSLTPGAPAGVVRPKLLNRDEVLANLRKYYPERERILGHEGLVIVDIHLGADGSVAGVDVVQPVSALFDAAAIKVAHIMRFSPAQTPDGSAVPSKVRERMQFKLTDE